MRARSVEAVTPAKTRRPRKPRSQRKPDALAGKSGTERLTPLDAVKTLAVIAMGDDPQDRYISGVEVVGGSVVISWSEDL